MTEAPLERILREQDFLEPLGLRATSLERISRSLLEDPESGEGWLRRHYHRLLSEAGALESFLDDYGARYNRTYHFLTELVASLRGLAHSGFGIQHLLSRFDGYGVEVALDPAHYEELRGDLEQARAFFRSALLELLGALLEELEELGCTLCGVAAPAESYDRPDPLLRLPRNLGEEDPVGEEQRIAEVATKYKEACGMLEDLGIKRLGDPVRREEYLAAHFSEERSRVYEATVHNLQSAYDTFIKNTVIESRDTRLPRLRGHISVALHLLEVATELIHFVERHEAEERTRDAARRLSALVSREDVRQLTLDVLLYWAGRVLTSAEPLATELLPAYMDLSELQVELEGDIVLHARPASLIVGIVNHHGTAVEMEVEGATCNAGSILELMMTVGTHPEARSFVFRGDAQPLRDIQLLFENGVGERGLDALPEELDYLRH